MNLEESFISMKPTTHVMVVDSDMEFLLSTGKRFEHCSYQVTLVDHASKAMEIILSGIRHFDIIIAEVNSDIDGFLFCQQVAQQGILVLLTSAIQDVHLTSKAIRNGAFMFVQKPLNEFIVKCLWQFVVKKRLQQSKGKETTNRDMATKMMKNGTDNGAVITGSKGKNNTTNIAPNDKQKNMNGIARMGVDEGKIQKRTYRKRKEPKSIMMNPPSLKDSFQESHSAVKHCKKKVSLQWTEELHKKFMKAVKQLGHGRCYPTEILEIMNIPGLTRMQVASHLQKCRDDMWKVPGERRSRQRMQGSFSAERNAHERERKRVFGSMPRGKDNQGENQLSFLQIPVHINSASYGTINTTTSATNPESVGSFNPANSTMSATSFDFKTAEFILDMPTNADNLFPDFDINIMEFSPCLPEVDMPSGFWDDIPLGPPLDLPPAPAPTPAQDSANVSLTKCAAIPLEAPEPTIDLDSFFNKEAPDVQMASWTYNHSHPKDSNKDLPPSNP